MTFEGQGRRQAITVDLDLRYARFAALVAALDFVHNNRNVSDFRIKSSIGP